MNKQSLDMLERAFAAEIDGALNKHLGLLQTRSKAAKKLEEDGMLVAVCETLYNTIPVVVCGYRLTERGRMEYCMSDRCSEPEEETEVAT